MLTAASRSDALIFATRSHYSSGTDKATVSRPLYGQQRATAAGRSGGLRAEVNGKVGTLLQFTVGTVEVDGKRYSIGLKDLEQVDDPNETFAAN